MKRISNQEIKQINRYKIKKHRQQDQLFIAEGSKVVSEIFNSTTIPIQRIVIIEKLLSKYKTLYRGNTHITLTDEKSFKKMSNQKHPEGILALCKIPNTDWHNFDFTQWTIALDNLNDPGNLGTIIRLADWFGISQLLCNTNTVDVFNPKVVQASMGSIARVNVCYENLQNIFENIQCNTYVADLEGTSIYEIGNIEAGILLIGNESHGVSKTLRQMATKTITIPRKGQAESLNAGVATGIVLSHLVS